MKQVLEKVLKAFKSPKPESHSYRLRDPVQWSKHCTPGSGGYTAIVIPPGQTQTDSGGRDIVLTMAHLAPADT